jgi:hypothetical protein
MTLLFGFLRSLFIRREALMLENLALRQQLAAYKRACKRPRLQMRDRAFWVWLSKLWQKWPAALVIVKPETVIRWHRQGFKALLAMEVSPEALRQTHDPARAHRLHQADERRQSELG